MPALLPLPKARPCPPLALLHPHLSLKHPRGGPAAAALASAPETFQQAFIEAFLLIFVSEIGDKTFFIAVLLALQQPRSAVFTGTFGALAVMTVISVALGRVFHLADEALPFHSDLPWDDALAVALLLFFGLKTLADANTPKAEEEEEGAKEAVGALGLSGAGTSAMVASTFALVFAAEWGDKSFLATIALSAAADPAGVVAGALAGHATATAIAVAGGSMLGDYVSERAMGYIGGSLFLAFAAATAAELVQRVQQQGL